ncbi:MAG: efflux RND transporter permease subunit [Candidatus Competibacteraceae bacterium]|nr:efflux RND transporter permease subunit [Candidatus Competibacteraceae bacterium]
MSRWDKLLTSKKQFEEGVIWRRNRFPAITVRAIPDGVQAPDVTAQINRALQPLRARLPDDLPHRIGGAQEASAKSQVSILMVMPLMVAVILTLLMIQLQSFQHTLIVLLTPLEPSASPCSCLITQMPVCFVAILGVIAVGIITRNAVILLDQIERISRRGCSSPWDAVVSATVRRFRQIVDRDDCDSGADPADA